MQFPPFEGEISEAAVPLIEKESPSVHLHYTPAQMQSVRVIANTLFTFIRAPHVQPAPNPVAPAQKISPPPLVQHLIHISKPSVAELAVLSNVTNIPQKGKPQEATPAKETSATRDEVAPKDVKAKELVNIEVFSTEHAHEPNQMPREIAKEKPPQDPKSLNSLEKGASNPLQEKKGDTTLTKAAKELATIAMAKEAIRGELKPENGKGAEKKIAGEGNSSKELGAKEKLSLEPRKESVSQQAKENELPAATKEALITEKAKSSDTHNKAADSEGAREKISEVTKTADGAIVTTTKDEQGAEVAVNVISVPGPDIEPPQVLGKGADSVAQEVEHLGATPSENVSAKSPEVGNSPPSTPSSPLVKVDMERKMPVGKGDERPEIATEAGKGKSGEVPKDTNVTVKGASGGILSNSGRQDVSDQSQVSQHKFFAASDLNTAGIIPPWLAQLIPTLEEDKIDSKRGGGGKAQAVVQNPHKLDDMLFMLLAAALTGAKTLPEIIRALEIREKWFTAVLGLHHGLPSRQLFFWLLTQLEEKDFKRSLGAWIRGFQVQEGASMPLHDVMLWETSLGFIVGQLLHPDIKGGDGVKAHVVRTLRFEGCVVMAKATGGFGNSLSTIVQKKGNYIVEVDDELTMPDVVDEYESYLEGVERIVVYEWKTEGEIEAKLKVESEFFELSGAIETEKYYRSSLSRPAGYYFDLSRVQKVYEKKASWLMNIALSLPSIDIAIERSNTILNEIHQYAEELIRRREEEVNVEEEMQKASKDNNYLLSCMQF